VPLNESFAALDGRVRVAAERDDRENFGTVAAWPAIHYRLDGHIGLNSGWR
jgi:hypothetical protein